MKFSADFKMRRLLACAILLLAWSHSTWAQGKGVIDGRLINGTDPKITPKDVEFDVVQLGAGMTIVKSAVADASGKFHVEGLPTEFPLMVRATYQMANYIGRISFDGAGKANLEIEVFETTESMKGIRADDVRIGFQLEGEHLRALETYSFINETNPRRTFMSKEGNFRFAKPEGIAELPRMNITGPGSQMPIIQSPLESPDGKSYYSLYPLRPGKTTIEVDYVLPYHDRAYAYRKKFYQDLPSFQVGVLPGDMVVSGEGLRKTQEDKQRNIAVYSGDAIKSGSEVVWNFAGGTPVAAPPAEAPREGGQVKPMPNAVGQNVLVIGPLLLMLMIATLWYAFNTISEAPAKGSDPRIKELKERRERLLQFVARLDAEFEKGTVERGPYTRRREQAKRQLRHIAMLLAKK